MNDNNITLTARITRFDATNPERLTKRFSLDETGQLVKDAGGMLYAGNAQVVSVESLDDFRDVLVALEPHQALTYGVPANGEEQVEIVTKAEVAREPDEPGVIARSKEHMVFMPGKRGICFLDVDDLPGGMTMTEEEAVAQLRRMVPGMADVAILSQSSASTYIFNGETGEELKGAGGIHLYFMVEDASDIERVGEYIFDTCWRHEMGFIKISSSGALLERAMFDKSVWQPNRLDFASGADCVAPLEQRRPQPTIWPGGIAVADTRALIPNMANQYKGEVRAAKEAAKEAAKPEARRIRREWLKARSEAMAGPGATSREIARVRQALELMLDGHMLGGNIILDVEVDGVMVQVSVEDILSDPDRYNGCLTTDPADPDYDGGRLVGKIYIELSGETIASAIISCRRGDVTYTLEVQSHSVSVRQGQMDAAVNATLSVMRHGDGRYFDGANGSLIWINRGEMHHPNRFFLDQLLGSRIRFFEPSGDSRVSIDPPADISQRILSMGVNRNLPPLKAILTAPTMLPDGTILQEPGYYAEGGGYILDVPPLREGEVGVPEHPTDEEVMEAFERLMTPFADFPFASAEDEGAMLAVALTAVVRPMLETAPAFGFDAPVFGTGKTLLAKCVAVMSGDVRAPVLNPLTGRGAAEEWRKRLMSTALSGASCMLIDNIRHPFNNESVAGVLTSGVLADRILGVSENANVPISFLMLFTGNNLRMVGDMARRCILVSLDGEEEDPHLRRFEFDPLQYVRKHRQSLVRDALTILKAGIQSDIVLAQRMGSFEDWDAMVRKSVMNVARVLDDAGVQSIGDPIEKVEVNAEQDDTKNAWSQLLRALHAQFKGRFTAKDVAALYPSTPGLLPGSLTARAVVEALTEVDEEDRKVLNSKQIGRIFTEKLNRRQAGLRLVKRGGGNGHPFRYAVLTDRGADIVGLSGDVVDLDEDGKDVAAAE